MILDKKVLEISKLESKYASISEKLMLDRQEYCRLKERYLKGEFHLSEQIETLSSTLYELRSEAILLHNKLKIVYVNTKSTYPNREVHI